MCQTRDSAIDPRDTTSQARLTSRKTLTRWRMHTGPSYSELRTASSKSGCVVLSGCSAEGGGRLLCDASEISDCQVRAQKEMERQIALLADRANEDAIGYTTALLSLPDCVTLCRALTVPGNSTRRRATLSVVRATGVRHFSLIGCYVFCVGCYVLCAPQSESDGAENSSLKEALRLHEERVAQQDKVLAPRIHIHIHTLSLSSSSRSLFHRLPHTDYHCRSLSPSHTHTHQSLSHSFSLPFTLTRSRPLININHPRLSESCTNS